MCESQRMDESYSHCCSGQIAITLSYSTLNIGMLAIDHYAIDTCNPNDRKDDCMEDLVYFTLKFGYCQRSIWYFFDKSFKFGTFSVFITYIMTVIQNRYAFHLIILYFLYDAFLYYV